MYRPGRSPNKPKAWFERSDGRLLHAEEALVNEFYPDLSFRPDAESGRLNLEGNLILKTDCGVTTSIAIRVAFPWDYPISEPIAFDAAGRFPVSVDRHIIKNGQFCLWLPPCSPWEKDDPNRLLRFLDEVTVFLERQLTFDATGGNIWPGDQYKHGAEGYEEFMLAALDGDDAHLSRLLPAILGKIRPGRNEVCPCGSQKKYKNCHLDVVAEIVGRIGRRTLENLYNKAKDRTASGENTQSHASA